MSSLQGKHVLLIEDSPEVRLLVRRILENEGAAVDEAVAVGAGVLSAQLLSPDLVILDLGFEEGSGFDFLHARRGDPTLSRVPLLVLSGSNDRESVGRAVSLGANDYLLKPLDAQLLLQKLRRWLSAPA